MFSNSIVIQLYYNCVTMNYQNILISLSTYFLLKFFAN